MKNGNDYSSLNIKRVALYLRLSKEDLEKESKDGISKSIKNQELMLRNEVNNNPNWKIVGVYCDEDFSGAGTYRPNFEKMIKSCENREIDIVLCKSQSRFSRDMEVIEKYIHNKFIEWNVRFVSLVDKADTENKENKKSRQINALINEWFLEDLSENIKSTFRAKWNNGECTSAFAKYGLIKDPKNKNHLLIDETACKVIRQIGTLFLHNYGQNTIARILNEKNIPSPYEYKLLQGSKLKIPFSKKIDSKRIFKEGEFIIKIYLYNDLKQILKNIKSLYFIGNDEKENCNSDFRMKVKNINDSLELYYTTDISININNLNTIDYNDSTWKKLDLNSDIPTDTVYLGSYVKSLDRLTETDFEIEIKLEKNKNNYCYKLYENSISNNNLEIKFDYNIRKKYKWTTSTINQILKSNIYNGTLVQGKTKRVSYKNHRCIPSKKEDWIFYHNALEKIFDDKTWQSIQTKLKQKNRSQHDGTKHIFAGKIYCDVCGNIFHKNCSYSTKGVKKEYFICKDKQNKWLECNNKRSIKYEELIDCILVAANTQLKKYYDLTILTNLNNEYIDKNLFDNEIINILKEKENIENMIDKKRNILEKLYEDRIDKIIDNDDFYYLQDKNKRSLSDLNNRLLNINKDLKSIELERKNLKNQQILLKYKSIKNLSLEFVNEFIYQIKIGRLDDKTNKRVIKIIWNI